MYQIFMVILIWLYASIGELKAEDDFSKEVIKSTQLGSSLYMLEGAGGNMTALIGKDGTLLVDDDFAQMADKLKAKLKELKGGIPKFIINTHFHYDHTGGNEVFGPSSIIIGSENVRERLMHEQTFWKKQHPPVSKKALPSLTFKDSLTLFFNSEEVQILHLTDGHTDGDTIVFFKTSHVISLGDLYFSGMYPIFHPEHKGSLEGYVKNIETVLSMIPDHCKIVSGHGPLTVKSDLEKYRQMIVSSIETVKLGMNSGLTLEQIQKKGLDPKWREYSHGYLSTDRWLALIYSNLK